MNDFFFLIIGLMFGISFDGVDGVLVVFDGQMIFVMLVVVYVFFFVYLCVDLMVLQVVGYNEIECEVLVVNVLVVYYVDCVV